MVTVNDFAGWRERIFSSLLTVVLIGGTASTILIAPFLLQEGMWPVALADTVTLVWVYAIWRLKHLSYAVRVSHFLAVVYLLAIVLTLYVGPASLSYLLGPPLIAAILLSLRPALLALALGAASLIALGTFGHMSLSVPGWEQEPLKASLVAVVNYSTVGLLLTLTCTTLLKGLASSLAELELTSAAVARLNDMVLIATATDTDKGDALAPITFVNDAFLRRTGYTRDEVAGRDLNLLQGPDTDGAEWARILGAMRAGQPCKAELTSYTRAGAAFLMELEVMPFTGAGGRASHWVVVGRDITERRTAADAIHRLAYYDVLTGLPNRRFFMERLGAVLAQAGAADGRAPAPGAVLYLDLDNFKNVNDARGHATGDALLGHVAARLSRAVRAGDTVARIGGDEFVILLEGLGPDRERATRTALELAALVMQALAAPLDLDGQPYRITASIGVALPQDLAADAADLLREADTAMYHAKAGGRNGVILFESAMLAEAQQRLMIERDLARALERGELSMHLQLQVDRDAAPVGAELLMRWQRADGSWVRPDVFIPVAESSGMIVALGNWALRQGCAAWLAMEKTGHPVPLSINVSPLQFRQPDFVDQVRAIFAASGAPPRQFIFEVTEGLLVEDIDQTIARMHELAALGIRFSIDDFGTGYSNLAYLSKMPLHELKIDKRFMDDTPNNRNDTAIVHSILSMAGHLGLRVVAEGIETHAQASYLAAHGDACMQGYLFHRPMPLERLIAQLDNSNVAAAG